LDLECASFSGEAARRRAGAMPILPSKPVLTDFQRYVVELEEERGFADQGVLEKCLLLGEEIGELFRAVRKLQGIRTDASAQSTEAEGELADILIYICSIANRLGVDLEAAFRAKEKLNSQRTWV
jgi:NTP pyrophosphatase (non-canonical NTP hydrolase)